MNWVLVLLIWVVFERVVGIGLLCFDILRFVVGYMGRRIWGHDVGLLHVKCFVPKCFCIRVWKTSWRLVNLLNERCTGKVQL